MPIVALPLLSVVAAEAYPPPLSVTVPVGVGLPLPPFTATVTESGCTLVMLGADGVTVMVGVSITGPAVVPAPKISMAAPYRAVPDVPFAIR